MAIWLWFEDRDIVSVHLLTSAGNRIILDLAADQGLPATPPFNEQYLVPGLEKEMKKAFRLTETFIKHAKEDPNAVHDFKPLWTELYLFCSIVGYHKLFGDPVPDLMILYTLRLAMIRPECFGKDPRPILCHQSLNELEIDRLKELSNPDCFAELVRILKLG